MRFTRSIIGMSALVVAVLLLVVTIWERSKPSLSPLTAALTRGITLGTTRSSVQTSVGSSAAASKSSVAAVSLLSLPTNGFSISYPKSWTVKQDPQGGGVMNVNFSSAADNFFMVATLSTNKENISLTLDGIIRATLASIPSALQFKVVKTESGTIAGTQTRVLTVTQKANGTLLKGQQVFLIKGKTLCVFFFTNVPEKFDQSLLIFNSVLKTVTLR